MGRWMAVKNRKAAADAKKGVSLAKLSHEIIRAAKLGGGDPTTNYRLKTAIERARLGGLPNAKIDNAIARGSGQLGAEETEDLTYEGYGPGGVAIFIEASTDNRNRTAGDVRSYFNKNDGNLGTDGSVSYLFQQVGLVAIPRASVADFDTLFELAAELGADDALDPEQGLPFGMEEPEAPSWLLLTTPEQMDDVCRQLSQQSPAIPILSAEWIRLPQNQVLVEAETVAKPLIKLLEALEAHDDVQAVYTNASFHDALIH